MPVCVSRCFKLRIRSYCRRLSAELSLPIRTAPKGKGLRELYRALNLPAKRARQLAQDLVRAGLIVERLQGRAEWYVSSEFAD